MIELSHYCGEWPATRWIAVVLFSIIASLYVTKINIFSFPHIYFVFCLVDSYQFVSGVLLENRVICNHY